MSPKQPALPTIDTPYMIDFLTKLLNWFCPVTSVPSMSDTMSLIFPNLLLSSLSERLNFYKSLFFVSVWLGW